MHRQQERESEEEAKERSIQVRKYRKFRRFCLRKNRSSFASAERGRIGAAAVVKRETLNDGEVP